MYRINFNHLYYFLTIAKEGSIVKASKKLHVTQPALSHQLRLLEEDLEKKLFDRVGKRLVLNNEGAAVKEYADKIFRHSEEMIQFLKSDSPHTVKIIKIGTVPWLSKDEIYSFIKPFIFSQHIRVEVYQKDLETFIKDIQGNRLDIILCDSPYSGRSKKLQGHRLSTETLVCVSGNKQDLKGKFPQSLEGKKFINYSEACMTADKIDDFFERNNISVQTVGAFTDSALIKTTVEKGGVLTFLPLSIVKDSLKTKKLFKVGEIPKLKFSLWAIIPKDTKRDSLIFDLLKKYKVNK
jgi:LysR family transcriptional activator of nhaA